MSSSVPITDRVAALSDEQVVTTLALVLERQVLTVDPFTQAEQEAHLREALDQPEITDSVEPTPGATRGDLARTALTYLADGDDATRGLIDHAMQIAPRADRDPMLLAPWCFSRSAPTSTSPTNRERAGRSGSAPRTLRLHDRKTPRPAPRNFLNPGP